MRTSIQSQAMRLVLVGAFVASCRSSEAALNEVSAIAREEALVITQAQPQAVLSLRLGTLTITIDSAHSLNTLPDLLGPNAQHGPRPTTGEYWLCYTSLDSSERSRVTFMSYPETGGERIVQGIELRRGSASDSIAADCPTLIVPATPMRFSNGLQLSMQRVDVFKVLGTPVRQSASRLEYSKSFSYERSSPSKPSPCPVMACGLVIEIIIDTSGSRVERIEVWYVRSS